VYGGDLGALLWLFTSLMLSLLSDGLLGSQAIDPLDKSAKPELESEAPDNRLRNLLIGAVMRARMRDVAKLAGVSTATVSHVLNNTRYVEPATSERVRIAIEQLGYEINGVAQSLRVRSTSTFALIIPDLTNPFFPELAMAIQHSAARAGYDVAIFSVDAPGGSYKGYFEHYLRGIRQDRYDVVIFAETMPISPTARDQLVATGTPLVLISGVPHPQADRVYIDDYHAAQDLMSYLVGKGHTTIAHITGAQNMPSTYDRQRAYRDALFAAGLPIVPELEVPGTFLRDGGYVAMQHLLARSPRPTAVFAANDLTAFGAMLACVDAGVGVPDEIAIAGFDDIALAADLRPALTTVYHGQREIGAEVVRLAVARARDEAPATRETTIVPHRLVVRQSA
jgi:LacI family transcriptional regulator